MIEEYLNTIRDVSNYVDGLLVIDVNYKVVYIEQNRPFNAVDMKWAIGKTLFEVYPQLKPENSTMVQAIRYGKITLNHDEFMYPAVGKPNRMIDSVFPIKENGVIIGAVSVATYPDSLKNSPIEVYTKQKNKKKALFTVADIIGRSPQIENLRLQIGKVAKTNSSVLIYGATGTGKELVAQSIHSDSDRSDKPFVSQNCAAIPSNLLESIFFGSAKGGYTGAENTPGLFERAHGGTLFLDEINSMDISLQAKLLRVLEEKKVTRIGGSKEYDIDVRIIAATNQEPLSCVSSGKLRPDLFYRLGSVSISLPPLEERLDDIELLAQYFISLFNKELHKNLIGVSMDVMEVFRSYDWPGNVREFKNTIEGAFNLCEGQIITTSDLPSYILSASGMKQLVEKEISHESSIQWLGSLENNMHAYEKILINDAINKNPNLSAAAKYLGITRQCLNQKLKRLGLR